MTSLQCFSKVAFVALSGTTSIAIPSDYLEIIKKQTEQDKDFILPIPQWGVLQKFYEEKWGSFVSQYVGFFNEYDSLEPQLKNNLIEKFQKELQSEACQTALLSRLGPTHFFQPIATSKQTPALVWDTFIKSPQPQQVPHMDLTARTTVGNYNISMFSYMILASFEQKAYQALHVVVNNMTPAQWAKLNLNEKIGEDTVITKLLCMPYSATQQEKKVWEFESFRLQIQILSAIFKNITDAQWSRINFNHPLSIQAKVTPLWLLLHYVETSRNVVAIATLNEFIQRAPASFWQQVQLDDNSTPDKEPAVVTIFGKVLPQSLIQKLSTVSIMVFPNNIALHVLKKLSEAQLAKLDYKDSWLSCMAVELWQKGDPQLLDYLMMNGSREQIDEMHTSVLSKFDFDKILIQARWQNFRNFCISLGTFLGPNSTQENIQFLFDRAQACAEDGRYKAYLMLGDALKDQGDFENAQIAYQAYVDCTTELHSGIYYKLASMYFTEHLTPAGVPNETGTVAVTSRKTGLLKAYHYVCKMDPTDPMRTVLRNNILAHLLHGLDPQTGAAIRTEPYNPTAHPLVAKFTEMADQESSLFLLFDALEEAKRENERLRADLARQSVAMPAAVPRTPSAPAPITPARDATRKRHNESAGGTIVQPMAKESKLKPGS